MLVRRDSLVPVLTSNGGLDRLFEDFFGTAPLSAPAGSRPAVDAWEDEKSYHVEAELPGLKADDLSVETTDNNIAISGERKIANTDKTAKYHRREREYGRFSRIVSVPKSIVRDKIEAKLNDGILTITIPKAEAEKPKQITIK